MDFEAGGGDNVGNGGEATDELDVVFPDVGGFESFAKILNHLKQHITENKVKKKDTFWFGWFFAW